MGTARRRVWAPLPRGATEQFRAVPITVKPEAPGGSVGEAKPVARGRGKVSFDGSTEPVIEIRNHSLNADVLPAIFVAPDGSGPNDHTGLGMGLRRKKQGGYLEVDYYGLLDSAVAPEEIGGEGFLRGDCNSDGAADISDASCILNWLFPRAACHDCHAEHDADDKVFVQFYPVLRPLRTGSEN